ncbi:hypothetical protein [Microbispora sp. NPDC046933]|uniref:hypothetical protein n=1 Tax=Microbispora sp. NPDC046933 TaxID=3155618 RepID=UPI00340B0743
MSEVQYRARHALWRYADAMWRQVRDAALDDEADVRFNAVVALRELAIELCVSVSHVYASQAT